MNALGPPARLVSGAARARSSSFAPAFLFLGRARRRDLAVLYAFCRAVDDVADADGHSATERREALAAWRAGFAGADFEGLPEDLGELIRRRRLDPRLCLELLDGVETDLAASVRMPERAALDLYCHRVAGVVGRLCLPVFGADPARAADYAETLGRALQRINILRDTADDVRRGRIYFPIDELAAAGLDAGSFAGDHERRQRYLESFAAESDALLARAEEVSPAEDREALRPARVMASVYGALLAKMRDGGLRVIEERYRLTTAEKALAALRGAAGG